MAAHKSCLCLSCKLFVVALAVVLLSGCVGKLAHVERQVSGTQGTGWTVFPGYLVTNFHVISPAYAVVGDKASEEDLKESLRRTEVYVTYKGHTQRAEIVAYDNNYDFCLLSVRDTAKAPPALPLASEPHELPAMGQYLYHVGFPDPLNLGYAPKFLDGRVAALLRYNFPPLANANADRAMALVRDSSNYQHKDYPALYLMTTIPGVSGSSGGPVFNREGSVVGMFNMGSRISVDGLKRVSSYMPVSFPLQTSYAIPVQYVESFCLSAILNSLSEKAKDVADIDFSLVDRTPKRHVPYEDSVALVSSISSMAPEEVRDAMNKFFEHQEKAFKKPEDLNSFIILRPEPKTLK